MRIAVLLVAMAVAGCAPHAEVESTPTTEDVPEPAPLYIPSDDPNQAERMISFRDNEDRILRGLARGEIRAGDPIEPLVQMVQFQPRCQVTRSGEYVTIASGIGRGSTQIIANGGKLIAATTTSCIFQDVFFDGRTEAMRMVHWKEYDGELARQRAIRNPPAK